MPCPVARTDRTILRRAKSQEDGSRHAGAIQSERHGPSKLGFLEHGALLRVHVGFAGAGSAGVQVEPEEVQRQAGTEVFEYELTLCRGAAHRRKVLWLQRLNQVQFSGQETKRLRVSIRDNEKCQGVQIRERLTRIVLFPVEGIELQNHFDSRLILFQTKWSRSGNVLGRCGGPPHRGELPLLESF